MIKHRISDSIFAWASIAAVLCAVMAIPACAPTYPKEKLPEAVKEICKIEYDMDVDVTVIGGTMGIYYPMKGLLDPGMGISEGSWDKISNLLLIASRVVLSTDADIKFYCVITQDARLPELQVIIIKYVDDIKPGGIVIYDPDMVPKTKPMKGIKVYTVPTMRIAEQTGRKIVANMVMVGSATAATGIVSQQAVEKTIEKLVPRGTEKLNISAFKAGYDHIKKIMVDDNVTGH